MITSSKQKPVQRVKRGQAAMEFLMTYGWAILVVLVVIAALAYFGVLDPTNILPDRCTFPITLTCSDYLVKGSFGGTNDDSVGMVLVNNGGKDLTITGFNVSGTAILNPCGLTAPSVITPVLPITLGSGQEQSITITGCNLAASGKKKDKYIVTVQYNLVGSTFVKTLQGELLTKRES